MKMFIFFIIFMLFIPLSMARVPIIYALHINGINTNIEEAEDNTFNLMLTTGVNSNMVQFDLIYNPTGDENDKGFWSNLTDVSNQKASEQMAIMSLDDYTTFYMQEYPQYAVPEETPEYDALKLQMTGKYQEELIKAGGDNTQFIIDEFHGKVPMQFASMLNLLDQDASTPYDYSQTKDCVLLLPHSQGNLYANDLYTYLVNVEHFNTSQLGVFGIASPANQNLGSTPVEFIQNQSIQNMGQISSYITSDNDFVVGGSRVLYPGTILPNNFNIPFSMTSPLGHSLIDVYLTNNNSSAYISKMINSYIWFYVDYLWWYINSGFVVAVMPRPQFGSYEVSKLIDVNGLIMCNTYDCPQSQGYYAADPNKLSVVQYPLLNNFYFFDEQSISHGNYQIVRNTEVIEWRSPLIAVSVGQQSVPYSRPMIDENPSGTCLYHWSSGYTNPGLAWVMLSDFIDLPLDCVYRYPELTIYVNGIKMGLASEFTY